MLNSFKDLYKITTSNLNLRLVELEDAKFILRLRLDPIKNRFISSTSPDLNLQKNWISKIRNNSKEKMFIVHDLKNEKFGTIRIYNVEKDSFTWGSWLFREDSPFYYSLESALVIYECAIKFKLGSAKFDVRKDNVKVWKFHENFGAKRVNEDQLNYYYQLDQEQISKGINKYIRFRPNSIMYYSASSLLL